MIDSHYLALAALSGRIEIVPASGSNPEVNVGEVSKARPWVRLTP